MLKVMSVQTSLVYRVIFLHWLRPKVVRGMWSELDSGAASNDNRTPCWTIHVYDHVRFVPPSQVCQPIGHADLWHKPLMIIDMCRLAVGAVVIRSCSKRSPPTSFVFWPSETWCKPIHPWLFSDFYNLLNLTMLGSLVYISLLAMRNVHLN